MSWAFRVVLGPAPPPPAERPPPPALVLSLPLQTWHLDSDVTTKEHLPLSPSGLASPHGLVLLHPGFAKVHVMLKTEMGYSPLTRDPRRTAASRPRAGTPGARGSVGEARELRLGSGGSAGGCHRELSPGPRASLHVPFPVFHFHAPLPHSHLMSHEFVSPVSPRSLAHGKLLGENVDFRGSWLSCKSLCATGRCSR